MSPISLKLIREVTHSCVRGAGLYGLCLLGIADKELDKMQTLILEPLISQWLRLPDKVSHQCIMMECGSPPLNIAVHAHRCNFFRTIAKHNDNHLSKRNFSSSLFTESPLAADTHASLGIFGVSLQAKEWTTTKSRSALLESQLWRHWSDVLKDRDLSSNSPLHFYKQFRANAAFPRFWSCDVDNFTASIRCRARMNVLRTPAFEFCRKQRHTNYCDHCFTGFDVIAGDLSHMLLDCPRYRITRNALVAAIDEKLQNTQFSRTLSLHHLLGSDYLPLANDPLELKELVPKSDDSNEDSEANRKLFSWLLKQSASLLREIHSDLASQ